MYDNILVATDGSEHATTAAEHAVEVADRYDATVHALYVMETRTEYDNALFSRDEIREHLREIAEDALDDVERLADQRDLTVVRTIEEGIPPEIILEYVDRNDIDFVFMGEQGRSAFKTILLGSTVERVLHETDVPVAVV